MNLHKNAKGIALGQRFGLLVVLSLSGKPKGRLHWLCQCDCGKTSVVAGTSLRAGVTNSCGCLRLVGIRHTKRGTHGMTDSPSYLSWTNMRARCTNPNVPGYSAYGGRGITVCERWQSFEAFLEDMGERPAGTSLDRIDNSGGYEPGNCRWASRTVQNRNKRNQHWIEFRGQRMTVAECCDLHGIAHDDAGYIYSRLLCGWDVERAFSLPPQRTREAEAA